MFELFANEYLRKSSPEKEAFAELDSHWYELTDIVIEKKIDIILKGLEMMRMMLRTILELLIVSLNCKSMVSQRIIQ